MSKSIKNPELESSNTIAKHMISKLLLDNNSKIQIQEQTQDVHTKIDQNSYSKPD